jgi:ATPase subunit of ABC transporter with duplicated ATPase domains
MKFCTKRLFSNIGNNIGNNIICSLAYFTQDLAQQLDPTARAVDLVTAYAREGPHGDITVSDQDARGVMGRLGLSGDKPLRKISDLSGGEKARVALSMFAQKPSNVILLDEPSNVSVASMMPLLSFLCSKALS